MKYSRHKKYVHILFREHGKKRARWYWAIKRRKGSYKRVLKDGDEVIRERTLKDGTVVCTEELLIGIPEEEIPAHMNLHYAELEEIDQ